MNFQDHLFSDFSGAGGLLALDALRELGRTGPTGKLRRHWESRQSSKLHHISKPRPALGSRRLDDGLMDGTICLGRNVGDEPMDDVRWQYFVEEVVDLVGKHGGEVFTIAFGGGAWDGISEESAVIVFGAAAEGFAAELSILASSYDQDAIGLLSGT